MKTIFKKSVMLLMAFMLISSTLCATIVGARVSGGIGDIKIITTSGAEYYLLDVNSCVRYIDFGNDTVADIIFSADSGYTYEDMTVNTKVLGYVMIAIKVSPRY